MPPIFTKVLCYLSYKLASQIDGVLFSEQGRLDGAFCHFTLSQKMQYLKHLRKNGVANIEMEVIPFAAMTFQAGIRSAAICVTLLNRLEGDQVTSIIL